MANRDQILLVLKLKYFANASQISGARLINACDLVAAKLGRTGLN